MCKIVGNPKFYFGAVGIYIPTTTPKSPYGKLLNLLAFNIISEFSTMFNKANDNTTTQQHEIKMTYEKALDKLQSIISSIENEEISIDELSKKTKEANQLIEFCRTKLRDVAVEIEGLD